MAFLLECEHCAQKFRVKEAFVGRKFRCKACGKANEITEIPIEAPEPIPVKNSDAEVPVSMALPPVVSRAKKKPKKKVEDDSNKDDVNYDLLTGRAGVLGEYNEDEAAEQKKVMMQVGGVFGGILLLLVAGGLIHSRMNNTPDKLVPKEYTEVPFAAGGMLVDAPKDWEVKSGGGGNIPPYLTLKNNRVTFTMRANPRGSIMGGTADALSALTAGNVAPADETEGVHVAHVSIGQMISNEYVDYEETPPQVIRPAGFGSARICRYQGGTQFGTTEYGFRGTLQANGIVYRIMIQMPRWLRDDFEPAAKKIIAGIRPDIPDDLFDDEEVEVEVEVDPEMIEEQADVDPFTKEEVPSGDSQ